MANAARRRDPGGRLIVGLGRAGLFPFYGAAVVSLSPDYAEPAGAVLLGYGLAILAFLSGTLWGSAIGTAGTIKLQRLVLSNLLVLLLVAGWLLLAPTANAALQIALFWALYALEAHHSKRRGWYLGYRLELTVAVTPAYLLFLAGAWW